MHKSIVALLLTAAAPVGVIAAAQTPATVAQRAAVNGWGVALTDVTPDPAVRYGRLPNGMKYAIRANSTPKGAASIRLHFDFGSLAERDQERGLAHFIEHMAFNGSTHVPEGEMKKILERRGLAFGPDTNAFTNFDSTLYVLDVPKADDQGIDTALFLMRETASELKFDLAAVDRERGVILSEKRSRENFQLRQTIENLTFHLPQSTFPKRIPIGTSEVLTKATADEIANLYRRYYRPENATLVIVGDIDPAAIETKIRSKFTDWSGRGPAGTKASRGRVDFARPAEIGSFIDPAVEAGASITAYRPWEKLADTKAKRRADLIRLLGFGMMSRRLQHLANAPDSKIIGASASTSQVRDLVTTSSIEAAASDGQWPLALAIIEQELRRAIEHGFTPSELAVQLSDLKGGQQRAADQADTRSNAALAASILSVVDEDKILPTPQFQLDLFREIVPGITLAEINAEFRRNWAGSKPLVFVSDKKPVREAEVASTLAQSRKVAVLPQKDTGRIRFAYDNFGKPGTVVADSRIADLGVRTVRFANNVRLNIKRTDFEKGAVRYSVRVAGGQLAIPRDKAGLNLLIDASIPLAGLEKHSAEDLKQIMAGHGVRPGFNLAPDAIVAQGRTIPADLALQMKLTAAFMTAPGYRPEAASRWNAVVPLIDRQSDATPQGAFGSKAIAIIANDDLRFGLPPTAVLAQRNLGEAKAVLAPLLASAPIEIGVVGDVSEDAAIEAVAQTFGALPMRAATAPDYAESRIVRFRKTPETITLRHRGQADQAIVAAAFATDDDDNLRRTIGLDLLEGVLKQKLEDEIRETLGASYGVTVNSSMSHTYKGFGYMLISAVVAPEKVPAVEKAVADVITELIAKPVSDDDLARVRNPIFERISRDDRENGYWLGVIDEAQTDSYRLAVHRQRRDLAAAVTPEDLRSLARQYLVAGKELHFRVLPQDPKLAEAAEAVIAR